MIMAQMPIKAKPLPVVFLEMHILQQLKYESEMGSIIFFLNLVTVLKVFSKNYSVLHWDF